MKRRLEFSSWRAGAQVGAEAPSRGGDVRVEGGGDAGDVARGYGEETLRALREAGLRAEEVATSFSGAWRRAVGESQQVDGCEAGHRAALEGMQEVHRGV